MEAPLLPFSVVSPEPKTIRGETNYGTGKQKAKHVQTFKSFNIISSLDAKSVKLAEISSKNSNTWIWQEHPHEKISAS